MDTNEQKTQEIPSATKKPPKVLSEAAQGVIKRIDETPAAEEKIRVALEFMRNALSHSGVPRFKDFWDVRAHCLPLFKSTLNQAQRAELWTAYIEISMEARRLKEILDEQSAFAAEQIELAIASLEKDLGEYDNLINQFPIPDIADKSSALKEKAEIYEGMQRELNLLNALASRVNSLRKEVVKTDMRVKIRSKFFDRLSVLGDRIFPRRKELIKTLSEQFIADVDQFMKSYFQQEQDDGKRPPYYILREEIKVLQGIAKELTLSTHAFNMTREQLSRAWDLLRDWDKKRKEGIAQKRQAFQSNVATVKEKIAALAEVLKQEGMTAPKAHQEAKEVFDFMRGVELGRDDVQMLKNELRLLLQPFADQEKVAEQKRFTDQRDRESRKKETITKLLEQMQSLEAMIETISVEEALEKKREVEELFAKETPEKVERMRFDAIQRRVKDRIADKKATSALHLSENDSAALEQLKAALKERISLRDEVRQTLENYRKSLGSSGFDFEKAMEIREMIDSEKERLVKLTASVQELEEKIDELGG